MKSQIYQIILWLHVLAGFVSLTTGTLILFAKEGNRFHRILGRFYFWGMASVFATSLAMLAIYPSRQRLWFFSIVAVVSFYQTYTGRRALDSKKDFGYRPNSYDWFAIVFVIVGGFFASFFAIWNGISGNYFFSILFLFFFILGLSTAYQDFLVFIQRKSKVFWFFHHVGRMMGSFAATTTAFIVNIGPRFLPENLPMPIFIFMWVFPGVLIGFLSARWMRNRKNQMSFKLA